MKKNNIIAVSIFAAALTLFSACGKTGAQQTTAAPDGKSSTALTSPTQSPESAAPSKSFSSSKTDKYEGVRSEAWINDTLILVTKENKDLKPIHIFDQTSNIRNLYTYNLVTKEEKLLSKATDYVWLPSVSPDGKYVFYEKYADGAYAGLITDLDGNVKATFPQSGSASCASQVSWVDNENFVMTAINGDVSLLSIDSRLTKITGIGQMQTNTVAKAGNIIYYVSTERNLVAFDMGTKQLKTVKSNVYDFALFPQKDMFALEVKASESGTALILTDLDGNEKAALTEAKQVFAPVWSPDSKMLAYLVVSNDAGKSGLHIMDLDGKTDLFVGSDFVNVDNGLRWSPSGTKILSSISETKDMKLVDNTYVVTLS